MSAETPVIFSLTLTLPEDEGANCVTRVIDFARGLRTKKGMLALSIPFMVG